VFDSNCGVWREGIQTADLAVVPIDGQLGFEAIDLIEGIIGGLGSAGLIER